MKRRLPIFVEFLLAMSLLTPCASAQKPSGPPPPPPANPPSSPGPPAGSTSPFPTNTQPGASEDFVLFVTGKLATDDGSNLPSNAIVERVCNSKVRQQVYASPAGDFSMQLGSINDSATLDASAEGSSQSALPNKFSETGIPRRLLDNCDLTASVPGFDSPTIGMIELDPSGEVLQVGTIRVHRRDKVAGATVNAGAYRGAPQNAITAYEKGLEADRKGKLPSAQSHFEKAVEIHPAFAYAWFQLGRVLREENDKPGARKAYLRAADIDEKLLGPHLGLASLAFEDQNWKEVLDFTSPILERDPFTNLTGYTVELEPFNYGETYYYNAVANFQLNRFPAAERSARKAEQFLARSPQLHVLLGEIFARKKDYASAVGELRTYLELDPHAKDAEQVRGRIAELERLNQPAASGQPSQPD